MNRSKQNDHTTRYSRLREHRLTPYNPNAASLIIRSMLTNAAREHSPARD